ncbi:MAG TPA: prolyl oligopeptidase family serine peptidase [Thermoanaerobaculia bacterium]
MRRTLLLSAVLLSPVTTPSQAPPTPKTPVTDTYFGRAVRDDYRWLEDWNAPAVQAWSEAQNAHARAVLDRLPNFEAIRTRVSQIATFRSPSYGNLAARGGLIFALKNEPPRQQPLLVTLESPDALASERVLVDPNAIDAKGSTAIDFFVPSLDGRRVAVSLSEGGSEAGSVSVWDVASGQKLEDAVPRVNGGTAGGGVAWNADGTGFFYTRYPRAGERPPADLDFFQQVFFHRLGTPTGDDTYAIGKEFPRIAETTLFSSDDGRFVLATVKNGDGGYAAQYLRAPEGAWTRVADLDDDASHGLFGPDGALYLLSHKGAPRGRILRLAPGSTALASAVLVVPESETAVIDDFVVTPRRLYVADLLGGPSQLRAFDHDGKSLGPVPILPISSITGMLGVAGDELLFQNQSDLEPAAWYRAGIDGRVTKTGLVRTSNVNFADCEVVQETAVSKDGTKVPLRILKPRAARLDGNNPALLYAYGGYAISQRPGFDPMLRVWVEQGGVYAVAALRGGGEFGEGWHRAGQLTKKQNVFDDFTACAKRLIDARYTKPARLAIEGGSNGGLLMGAAFTQHPELFGAVVSHVGIYDMLRVELSPNGAFNITEFGTVQDPGQYGALLAYSPYHHVADGTAYPPLLFMTGANDPRVDPMQSRKMTARLQSATGGKQIVLLRTSSSSGHGIGSSLDEKIGEETDMDAFLFDRLGVAYNPIP